jgi:hypothetical protein
MRIRALLIAIAAASLLLSPASFGATSSHDLNFWKSLWLNHEVTHTMGVVDVYAATPGLLAYERWNLGWLDITVTQSDSTGDVVSIKRT